MPGLTSELTEEPITADPLLQPGWRDTRKTINGVDLHIVEAGDPGAPLLILLHGFPEFWWAWRHQITPLAEAGCHVVVPNICGYNTSEARRHRRLYARHARGRCCSDRRCLRGRAGPPRGA